MSEPLYPTLTILGGLEVVVNPELVRAIEPNDPGSNFDPLSRCYSVIF